MSERMDARNKEIIEKIDKHGWSFRQVAKHYGKVVSTIYHIYKREKALKRL